MPLRRVYVIRGTRPATARTWRGAAIQMARIEVAEHAMAIQNAGV
jgi:hypothetical protein